MEAENGGAGEPLGKEVTTTKVFFRGTHEEARRLALQLGDLLGRNDHPIGRAFMSAIGFGALSDIKASYLVKAKGGRDEMGIEWPPLKPETVARRRVGRRDTSPRARGRSNLELRRAVEQAANIKERQRIVKREEKKLLKRFLLSLPEEQAKSRARQVAEANATRITGRTKTEVLGSRQVEMLRDTGILFNSLSPGELTPGSEHKAQDDDQVFELNAGSVIVGTNVLYAATHNYGDDSRGIPRRQFLPDDNGQVPEAWWDRWFAIAVLSLDVAFRLLLNNET